MCVFLHFNLYMCFSFFNTYIYVYLSKFLNIIMFYTWLGERTQTDTAQPKRIILLFVIYIYYLLYIIYFKDIYLLYTYYLFIISYI